MSKVLSLILFISLAILILFLAHAFIYFTLVKLFGLKTTSIKIWLIIFLFILPLSFILSSVLIHYFDNPLVNGYYFLSGLWLGLLTNLIMGFLLAWILLGLSRLLHLSISGTVLGFLVTLTAISLSVYGAYNAYHPQTRHLEIKIKNLPAAWEGSTVVQISDLHLGAVMGENFFDQVVEKVNQINPSAVFITGDLFDGSGKNFAYLPKLLNKINAPRGVYFVTGNHETYFGLDRVKQILSPSQVKILQNQLVSVEGLQILGVDYPQEFQSFDLVGAIKNLPDFNPEQPSILLYHSPTDIPKVSQTGVDLELCGHTHAGQIFPFGLFTRLIFKGFDKGLHRIGDYTLYTSLGTGVWGPTIRTFAHPEIVSIKLTN